jgi:glycosyltransferase involved in cell wall biosynthesis
MLAYVRALRKWLPQVAPDLALTEFGSGDNFDLAEQAGMPLGLLRLQPRLVHFPTPYVPRFIPSPHVVTVHDVIDLEFPQHAKSKVGPYWRRVIGPVLRSARAVITDDEATVPLLEEYLRVDPARVRVIPLGVDAPNGAQPAARPRPYVFYAGNHRPHKDLATLVRAWSTLPAGMPLDLVLTGTPEASSATRGDDGDLVFAGDCSDADVWALHRGAVAYVHPALREGFGLPLLEAMRAGTPVIAADTALPSVLREFAQAFPPGDADALRELLIANAVAGGGDREAAEHARLATLHLTWERTARATAALYRELIG